MAWVCQSCVQHSRLLGIVRPPKSKAAIHKAYRSAAKLWHPDRFEGNPKKRGEAEERFKRIHAAYQALCEHFESPAKEPREAEFVTPIRPIPRPSSSRGGAPGCFTGPDFPEYVKEAIREAHLDSTETPVGFVDLPGASARDARFILLGNHRMYVRDGKGILSVIWYSDLGAVELIDPRGGKKPGALQWLAESLTGETNRYSLKIGRSNGSLFREFTDGPDDRVKKVIYNFLRQMKSKSQL